MNPKSWATNWRGFIMRWTKEEKLKMVLEYKKSGFTPIVDVLQIADKEMYANKTYLKEKYNMKGR